MCCTPVARIRRCSKTQFVYLSASYCHCTMPLAVQHVRTARTPPSSFPTFSKGYATVRCLCLQLSEHEARLYQRETAHIMRLIWSVLYFIGNKVRNNSSVSFCRARILLVILLGRAAAGIHMKYLINENLPSIFSTPSMAQVGIRCYLALSYRCPKMTIRHSN